MKCSQKYLGEKCPGCWVAKTSDGTSVTFRPAGTASGKTLETTASVDVNNPTIRSLNISKSKSPEVLKLKFPEIKDGGSSSVSPWFLFLKFNYWYTEGKNENVRRGCISHTI